MTGRVRVTAGPHEVGFTWKERPFQLQDVWQPSRRDSQEIHMIGGLPKLKTVSIDGPYNVRGVSEGASRDRLFVCHPASVRGPVGETACATKILTNLARHALPASGYGRRTLRRPWRFTRSHGRAAAVLTTAFAPASRGFFRARTSCIESRKIRRDVRPGVAHPVSDVELASRLSFFLWSSIPDEKLLDLAAAGRLREPGVLADTGRTHARGRSLRRAGGKFHGPVAAAAESGSKGRSGPADVPGFRRQYAQRIPQGDRVVLRVHFAHGPQRSRPSERGLHVRR